jgi:hypothetical protein
VDKNHGSLDNKTFYYYVYTDLRIPSRIGSFVSLLVCTSVFTYCQANPNGIGGVPNSKLCSVKGRLDLFVFSHLNAMLCELRVVYCIGIGIRAKCRSNVSERSL